MYYIVAQNRKLADVLYLLEVIIPSMYLVIDLKVFLQPIFS